jgi:hypothetical protein
MPKSLLIDSDILIDHLRKDKKALDFLDGEIEKGGLLSFRDQPDRDLCRY